ncbi:hypothetical protein JOQ06_003557 [Pogonophryne albipinna]|uniref:Insulin n=1 Tax=Pogonophryne albipinna TaxID=1090488 RepID=A0AAD6AG03_9TELE|nr:hypothetical protein JOQ06_003557 [Pogonophryne albipinna]
MCCISCSRTLSLLLCVLTLTPTPTGAGPETLCGAELVDTLQFVCGERGFYFTFPGPVNIALCIRPFVQCLPHSLLEGYQAAAKLRVLFIQMLLATPACCEVSDRVKLGSRLIDNVSRDSVATTQRGSRGLGLLPNKNVNEQCSRANGGEASKTAWLFLQVDQTQRACGLAPLDETLCKPTGYGPNARRSRGIVDECCFQSCELRRLEMYCAPVKPNKAARSVRAQRHTDLPRAPKEVHQKNSSRSNTGGRNYRM